MTENLDKDVVAGFGDEWSRFDQSALDDAELRRMFENYFNIFPWTELPPNSVGFDLGCGSGRWAKLVAPRVGHLHLIDPSEAIEIAKRNRRSIRTTFARGSGPAARRSSMNGLPLPTVPVFSMQRC
jgi:SAM-dependent methyltransferase